MGIQRVRLRARGRSGHTSISTKLQGHRPAKSSRIELRATKDDPGQFVLDVHAQQGWGRRLEGPSPFG